MHPACVKSDLLLENGVGDDKLLLSAKLQLLVPVVFVVTNTVSAEYYFPRICILTHSSSEITKDYNFLVCRGVLDTASELLVEHVFFYSFRAKSWCVHTEKRGIPLIFQMKVHGYQMVGMTSCQIFQPGEDGGADHETVAWKAPLCYRLLISLRSAMSRLNLDNSCAIRAERHSGQLLWASLSMVLTDCISHSTNTLGKGMNPFILPPAMGK